MLAIFSHCQSRPRHDRIEQRPVHRTPLSTRHCFLGRRPMTLRVILQILRDKQASQGRNGLVGLLRVVIRWSIGSPMLLGRQRILPTGMRNLSGRMLFWIRFHASQRLPWDCSSTFSMRFLMVSLVQTEELKRHLTYTDRHDSISARKPNLFSSRFSRYFHILCQHDYLPNCVLHR